MSIGQAEPDPLLVQMFTPRKWLKKAGAVPAPRPVPSVLRPGSLHHTRGSGRENPVHLAHNAFGVPQAVVKIVWQGRTRGGNALRDQLQYIGRSGETALRDETGAVCEAGEGGRHHALVTDWSRDFGRMDPRTSFYTHHVVVSYPAGITERPDRRSVEFAVPELRKIADRERVRRLPRCVRPVSALAETEKGGIDVARQAPVQALGTAIDGVDAPSRTVSQCTMLDLRFSKRRKHPWAMLR